MDVLSDKAFANMADVLAGKTLFYKELSRNKRTKIFGYFDRNLEITDYEVWSGLTHSCVASVQRVRPEYD